VQVADYAVARGKTVISTLGLGSCVAIVLHDPVQRVGAMAHVLLPDPALARANSNAAKFPTTAVPLLCEEMRKHGAGPSSRWVARLVGGASMFAALNANGAPSIGDRNVAAAREALRVAGLELTGEDVGGDAGRSVHFHVWDGRIEVRSLRTGTRVL
jgi:chemotaxis protein CheD